MASRPSQDLSPAQVAELSALADGSLDPARREEVEAWIASSPELSELYARERTAVSLLHQAAGERAPARLRLNLEGQRMMRERRPRRRTGYFAAAGALAAAAVALVLLLPGGAPGSPSVSQAAALALRGPAAPAPGPDPADPREKLADRFQEVYFPNWSSTLGWHAVGMRRDQLDGRPATTVYYRHRDELVAYTIVGAPALSPPSARMTQSNGYELRIFNHAARTVVTWQRAGHTCVLSAVRVPISMLKQLAGWRPDQINE